MLIGVDFDNTLICYAALMRGIALQLGLINPEVGEDKRQIRDFLRKLPEGKIDWQKLQAVVYGPRIGEAKRIDGVTDFFHQCWLRQVRVFIVSHKTEFARYDETHTNLRAAALAWMQQNGFFTEEGLGLSREDVYFESTRWEKIERLRELGCTHFIDDLEETFGETSFPAQVEKILFAPRPPAVIPVGVKVMATWQEIGNYVFSTHG